MSRYQDYTGSYVRFTGACDAGYLKGTLIVSEARWDHWGEEWRVRGSGNLSDWLPAELFEVVDKPDDADIVTSPADTVTSPAVIITNS